VYQARDGPESRFDSDGARCHTGSIPVEGSMWGKAMFLKTENCHPSISADLPNMRKLSGMKTPQLPSTILIMAILLITSYSAYTINAVTVSNAPPVVTFTLGTAIRDISYCNSQTLDLYVPSAGARPLPLVIYVHGGGFTGGDKADIYPFILNSLANAGYAVASVNYHLAPQSKFPAQIEDVECAIRYMRANAQTYGINGSEIFAVGSSVGGEMVAIDALTGQHSAFDVGPYPSVSSAVTAGVDMYGPANLMTCGCFANGIQEVFGGNQTLMVLASPTHYVASNSSPILIIQGVNDTSVPESQSVTLHDQLVAAGDQTQLILVQSMGHMFAQVGSNPMSPSPLQIGQDIANFFGEYRAGG